MKSQPHDLGENLSQKFSSRYWAHFEFKFFQIPDIEKHDLLGLISGDTNVWDQFMTVTLSTELRSTLIIEVRGLLHKKFLYDPGKAESIAKDLIAETWENFYSKLTSVEMEEIFFHEINLHNYLQKIFTNSFKVVVNRCIYRPVKKLQKYSCIYFEDWQNTNIHVAEEPFNQTDKDEEFMVLLAQCGFSKIEQRVMWLRHHERLSNRLIAQFLNMPLEKIQDIYCNAIRKARKKLTKTKS